MRLEFIDFIAMSPTNVYMSAAVWGKRVGLDPDIIRPRLTRYKKAGYITTKKEGGLNKYRLAESVRKRLMKESGQEKFKTQVKVANLLTVKDEMLNKFLRA
jgi:DNA-binding transcriptional regulator PaaX